MTTVAALCDGAFPSGTRQHGGHAGAGRMVTGTARYRARTPAFPALRGGELGLVPVTLMAAGGAPGELDRLVVQLAAANLAGIVLFDTQSVPVTVAQTADAHALPLFTAPPGCTPDAFDLAVTVALAQGRESLLAQSQAAQARFAALAMAGAGRQAIVDELARILGVPTAWEDTDARCIAWALPPDGMPAALRELAADVPALLRPARLDLLRWARGVRPRGDRPPAVDALALGDGRIGLPVPWHRLVVPITHGPRHLGYLSAIVPRPPFHAGTDVPAGAHWAPVQADPGTVIPMVAAAMSASLEESRTRVATDAQGSAIQAFLMEWVDGRLDGIGQAERLGVSLGLEMAGPFRAILVELERDASEDALGLAARETVSVLEATCGRQAGGPPVAIWAPISARRAIVAMLTDTPSRRTADLMGPLRRTIEDGPARRIGVSRAVSDQAMIARAVRDANRALDVATRVAGAPRAIAFDEMGVYRLLTGADPDELTEFCDATVGALREADVRNGGGLMQTLEAFLAAGGGLQETATAIHAHRNTVSYRIERIERLLGTSVRDPEARLVLGLAVRARALLGDAASR